VSLDRAACSSFLGLRLNYFLMFHLYLRNTYLRTVRMQAGFSPSTGHRENKGILTRSISQHAVFLCSSRYRTYRYGSRVFPVFFRRLVIERTIKGSANTVPVLPEDILLHFEFFVVRRIQVVFFQASHEPVTVLTAYVFY
jgi:hypothetical protein